MKAPSFVFLTALAIGLITALPAEAAKGNKNKAGQGDRQGKRMLAHFDTNRNGTIDSDESARLRSAFNVLRDLDKDKNGKLSDEEIAATKVPQMKGGKAGKKGKGKNKA